MFLFLAAPALIWDSRCSPWRFALAFVIGILLGLLGGGGSILMVPVLLYVLRMEPKSALASTQVILAATSAVAVVVHARASRVVFPSEPRLGSLEWRGPILVDGLPALFPTKLLLLGFTALMAISAVAMLRRRSAAATERPPPSLVRGAAVGSATGFLAGLLGVGGGFLIVPALTELGGLPMDRAIGTSLFVITLQASMGALGYLAHASVRWDVVPVLALVMALGSTAGDFCPRISVAALRRSFAILILIVAVGMLARNILLTHTQPAAAAAPAGDRVPGENQDESEKEYADEDRTELRIAVGREVGDLLRADNDRRERLHLDRRGRIELVPEYVQAIDEAPEREGAAVAGEHRQVDERPHVADGRHPQDEQGEHTEQERHEVGSDSD